MVQVSESVGVGHPDKIADYISDVLLEKVLQFDINSQFACEVLASDELIVVAGELFTSSEEFSESFVKKEVSKIIVSLGYDLNKFEIISNINRQSSDIRSASIESSRGILSGDQSIVFGYATNETDYFLPLSFAIASDLSRTVFRKVKSGELKGVKFDSKFMVILENEKPEKIFMSVQHEENMDICFLFDNIYELVVLPVLSRYGLSVNKERVFINHGGKFVIGGLKADTGITNRKLLVDSYGCSSRHGGGGYSGKDLTKVDRLGAYYARWICKNLVAAGLCDSIELQLVYSFGSEEPIYYSFVSNTLKVDEKKLVDGVKKIFPVKFSDVYYLFNQPKIRYGELSRYGHFVDVDSNIPWEKLDKKDLIRDYFGIIG